MNLPLFMQLAALCLALGLTPVTYALTFDDLQAIAPPCKQTKVKRPRLPAEKERNDYAAVRHDDFNGDGWCDYALAVPYPINSQMPAFGIDEMMLLGGAKGWQRVLRGKRWSSIDEAVYSAEDFPLFQVDLTDIHLVYPKQGGAPFVLGLWASGTGASWQRSANPPHCKVYSSVYRWDDSVGAFRRVDEATAKVVIDYFYRFIAEPCASVGANQSAIKGAHIISL